MTHFEIDNWDITKGDYTSDACHYGKAIEKIRKREKLISRVFTLGALAFAFILLFFTLFVSAKI